VKQLSLAAAIDISLDSSFEDLLGYASRAMSECERRQRWARWLRLARQTDPDCAAMWESDEGCVERGRCQHLRGRAWCANMGLPATVNPRLSFGMGMIGMACMGMSYNPQGGEK